LNIDKQSKNSITDNITKLVRFGLNPRDKSTWKEAVTALVELKDTTNQRLIDQDEKEISFSSIFNELCYSIESLYFSPESEVALRDFETSLGGVEYRIKRLFGIDIVLI
jgi:hypothetical protein